MSAHDFIVDSLLTRASQLGADAWIDHEAKRINVELWSYKLNKHLKHHSHDDSKDKNISLVLNSKLVEMERKDIHIHVGNLFSDSIKRDVKIEALQHVELELVAERQRGDWISNGAQHAVSVRARQVVERAYQARKLVQLQHALRVCCAERHKAAVVHQSHQSKSNTESLFFSKLAVTRVCENLREQGVRRRFWQEQEVSFFRAEIKRLLWDQDATNQRLAARIAIDEAREDRDNVLNPCFLPMELSS